MPFGRALNNLISRKAPMTVAKASFSAMNERRWDDFRALADDDFHYLDAEGNEIDGADRFIAAMERLVADAPDFQFEVNDYHVSGNVVVMNGVTTSKVARFSTISAWRLDFAGGRISYWRNYRANDTIRLFEYATVTS
ncbi:hypothetical protein GRI89_01945 [Altererythrobacter salegens]|uniref:SnoaL-like domain-containing protein n=1 Tax=Croceibacterium salegens TaxID=1737568 RepID=A0A6I4STS5_9SPHN|nr:nuclear transport factor 2 family protein [Croceibacterium salegens]MXO58306.1 hypothetical protein [Croceibacterium salegens]